jgi:hypothetical protein
MLISFVAFEHLVFVKISTKLACFIMFQLEDCFLSARECGMARKHIVVSGTTCKPGKFVWAAISASPLQMSQFRKPT